jgi:hypothetical protein
MNDSTEQKEVLGRAIPPRRRGGTHDLLYKLERMQNELLHVDVLKKNTVTALRAKEVAETAQAVAEAKVHTQAALLAEAQAKVQTLEEARRFRVETFAVTHLVQKLGEDASAVATLEDIIAFLKGSYEDEAGYVRDAALFMRSLFSDGEHPLHQTLKLMENGSEVPRSKTEAELSDLGTRLMTCIQKYHAGDV